MKSHWIWSVLLKSHEQNETLEERNVQAEAFTLVLHKLSVTQNHGLEKGGKCWFTDFMRSFILAVRFIHAKCFARPQPPESRATSEQKTRLPQRWPDAKLDTTTGRSFWNFLSSAIWFYPSCTAILLGGMPVKDNLGLSWAQNESCMLTINESQCS